MNRFNIVSAAFAASVLIGLPLGAAQARIQCDGNFQVVQGGSAFATPYCQEQNLARVAKGYGMRVSFESIRASDSVFDRTSRLSCAHPNTAMENKELVETFRSSREEAYRTLIAGAERIKRKAELGGGSKALLEELGKLEREFRAERRRDYFRSPLRKEAASALKAAREAVREGPEGVDVTRSGS